MVLDQQDQQVQQVPEVFLESLVVLDKAEILVPQVLLEGVECQDPQVNLVRWVPRVLWVREDSQVLEYRVLRGHQDLMDEVCYLVNTSSL